MSDPAKPETSETTAETSVRIATAALTVTCIAWGASFVFLKDLDRLLQPKLGGPSWAAPLWITTVRFLVAGLLLLAIPAVHRALSRPVWRDALFVAAPSVLGYVLQVAGMRGVDAGTSAFLTSLYTPLTPLLAWLLLRQVPARRVLVAVLVAMGGVVLLSLGEHEAAEHTAATASAAAASGAPKVTSEFVWYASLVLLATVCWALQILAIDRWARRHPSGPFSCAVFLWISAGGALCTAVALALADPDALGVTRAGFVVRMASLVLDLEIARPLAGLVLFSTILAMTLMNRFQPCLDPSRAALLYTLEPAFAACFALVAHGEAFGGKKLAGCAVLLLANLLVEAPGLLALVRGSGQPPPAPAA